MKLYYQYEQFNKDLKRKKKSRKIRSRSYVKAFLHLMYTKVSTLTTTLPDYLNASSTEANVDLHFFTAGLNGKVPVRSSYTYSGTWQTNYTESSLVGIEVGTGTNAVTSTDYALQTRIAEGKASGQLEYGTVGFTPVTVSAPNASMTINRIFRNSSGGSITINELGIYALCHQNIYCIVRDMISSSPIVMADGDIVKITYTMTITA